jgi:hypothetical protein
MQLRRFGTPIWLTAPLGAITVAAFSLTSLVSAQSPSPGPGGTPRPVAVTSLRTVPGCLNVVAPRSETVAQVAARVDPPGSLTAIWKQVPRTPRFEGAPFPLPDNLPEGVADLAMVSALDAIFICVNAAGTYRLN